jgi:hypothetical protein
MGWRVMAACMSTLLLGGCPGDAALDEDYPIVLLIDVPSGDGGAIAFGDADVDAFGLTQSRWALEAVASGRTARIPTALMRSGFDGHCFAEAVVLITDGHESLLIEPGECSTSASFDRRSVQILHPRAGAEVGPMVAVEVAHDVTPDPRLRFFVNGDPVATRPGAMAITELDLGNVQPGPITLRVEVTARSRVASAHVIELTLTGQQ